jgi:hypothetical protein
VSGDDCGDLVVEVNVAARSGLGRAEVEASIADLMERSSMDHGLALRL